MLRIIQKILDRGWWPYNRNLLLHYLLRATMTEEMFKWEQSCGYFGEKLLAKLHNVAYEDSNGIVSLSCFNKEYHEHEINFSNGITAQHVSTTIFTESDRQLARERKQKFKEEGITLKDQLNKINRKMTSGKMILGVCQYGLKNIH